MLHRASLQRYTNSFNSLSFFLKRPQGRAIISLASLLAFFWLSISVLATYSGSPARREAALSANIVISQVYGGGGNTGAPYTNDFIELFNRGNTSVSVAGWSVQYTSATGTGNFAANKTDLPSVMLAPGQYLLVQEGGGANGSALPTPDATGTITMSATAGKVILANTTTGLACNGSSTACSPSQLAQIVDLVGFGTANFFEGAGPTLAPGNTTSVLRGTNGCTETDNNAADFATGAPSPRNTSTTFVPCGGGGDTLTLSCTPTTFSESAGAGVSTCTVTRTGSTATSLLVTLSSGDTTEAAVAVPDVTISAGQASTTFTLNAVDDVTVDSTQTVTITTMASGFSNGTFQVMVTDDDAGATLIHDIQGSAETPNLSGATVTIQGIVVGDFQTATGLTGFFVEEETAEWDGDVNTSEGIFVADPSAFVNVAVGDKVTVIGTVANTFGLTQISPTTNVAIIANAQTLPNSQSLAFPFTSTTELEKYEGMRVTFDTGQVISDTTELGRFGEFTISAPRLFTVTNSIDPNDNPASGTTSTGNSNVAAISAQQSLNDRSKLIIDDGSNVTNTGGLTPIPFIGAGTNATLRPGDVVNGLSGVMNYGFNAYRLEVTAAPTFTINNPRTAAPAAIGGGNVRVASFNVENYFLGPFPDPTGRGASNATEFTRQRDKIVEALAALNADVIGLIELELAGGNAAAADIAAALTTRLGGGANTYAAIAELGTLVGTDTEIKSSMIYRTSTVTTVGNPLTDTVAAAGTYSRDPVAQRYQHTASSQSFVVTVNHLRSRICTGASGGDLDQGDGQGCYNPRRRGQTAALASFVNTTLAALSPRVIVVGDLNSYAEEDPLDTLRAAGLADAVAQFVPAVSRYSSSFNNESGQLDHALVTSSVASALTGATIWHINSDEPSSFDYNTENKPDDRYAVSPARSSDHDLVLLAFNTSCPAITVTPSSVPTGTAGAAYGPVNFMQTGGNGTIAWSVSSNNLPAGLTLDPSTGVLSGTPTVAAGVNIIVRATDTNGCVGERTVTLQINCPTITLSPSTGPNTTLTSGTVGQMYSQTFSAAPAGGAYSYGIPLAAIPPGLAFNTTTGVLSGTPTTSGTYSFTVTATAFGVCTGQQAYTFPIIPACPMSFTINDLGDAPDQTPGDRVCQAASGACTLRAAIMEANAIPACAPLAINFGTNGTITLTSALPTITHPNLTINGPGASLLTVRAPNATTTIRVFDISGVGNMVTLSGLTITNGNVTTLLALDSYGGGIRNQGATLTLNNCVISNNHAVRGGGVVLMGGTLNLTGCTLSGNEAIDEGGALENAGGTVTANTSTFTGNSTTTLSNGDGGAYNSENPASVFNASNCLFSGNTAGDDGGAVDNDKGSFAITNCYFLNNTATDLAGALEDRSTSATNTLSGCTFNGNHAANDGGALYMRDGANTLTVTNSTFANNSAGGLGGAINVEDVGNTLFLVNCTLSGNSATLGTGGVYKGDGMVTFRNTIVANNTGGNCGFNVGDFAPGTANLEFPGATATCGSGTTIADPLLGTLQNNGGFNAGAPTTQQLIPTMLPATGSPALNLANAAFCPATDQRGVPRPQGSGCDIGAVEGAAPSITPVAVMQQQGSPASTSTIANVSDASQAANTLSVTVNGGATATVNGVTVSGLNVNAAGVVTANIVATCAASNASFTLRATNASNSFTEATLNVSVTANTSPALVYASPQTINAGGALNIPPTSSTDNGSVVGYQILSVSPALTVTPTINVNGVVSITNAGLAGNHLITVRVTDNCGATSEAQFTLNVTCPGITISPTTLAGGTLGANFNQTLTANGGSGTYIFTVTAGSLPPGLNLSSGGVLSGTPSTAGGFNFTVTATDSNSGCTGTRDYGMTVSCPTITLAPGTIPGGQTGVIYSQTVSASAPGLTGAYTFALAVGSNLPPGLSLSAAGQISGTPTQSGAFNFTVVATHTASGCTGNGTYNIAIGCPAITLTPTVLPSGTAGTLYNQALSAEPVGSNYAFTLTAGALPTGISLTANGALNGTPTVFGNFSFTVRATDNNSCFGEQAYTLRICGLITLAPATLPAGTTGTAYTQTLTASGGNAPYTFAISGGNLPPGLSLNSNGSFSGSPSQSGTFNFTVTATDNLNCAGTQNYALLINCPTVTITPASLANGFVGTSYSQTVTATGGTSPYSFSVSVGTLPAGLALSSAGALTGTPTTSGNFAFTIKGTDANGCMGMQSYTIIVSGNGLMFYPLPTPVRLLDTRNVPGGCNTNTGALTANSTRTQLARTICSTIPANATAVIGNITVVPASGGFVTLFPSDAAQPTVANTNFTAGEITNNFFTVGLGADGAFKIFASATTEVIIDLTGYYAPPTPSGLYYHPLPAPVRLVETRAGQSGCIQPGQLVGTGNPNADPALDLAVQGRGGSLASPCNTIPSDASLLVGNATVVFPTGGGYLTIYPSDATRPTVASSNYAGADIINGPFAVKLGTDGKFKVYTLSTTDLVIDITGYYSTSPTDANGAGLLFSPLPKPMRLLETRDIPGLTLTGCYQPKAQIQGGSAGIRTQPAWGSCADQPPLSIPNTARALVGNASVVNSSGVGFGTFFPGDVATAPTIATTNYTSPVAFGYNRHFYVGLSPTDGTFKILTQATSDYIVDVSGYFAP